jgi:hypothetical protein
VGGVGGGGLAGVGPGLGRQEIGDYFNGGVDGFEVGEELFLV